MIQCSSSVEQLKSSASHGVQTFRDELRIRECALYSGVGVIHNVSYNLWDFVKHRLSTRDYKIIPNIHLYPKTPFATIAQSIAYPKTAAESSDSPPFVIAIFISGQCGHDTSTHTLYTRYGLMDTIDDIIQPFLPQSAPHLQHIPKLFFITVEGNPDAPPPQFPDDPDGNYCVAYHVTNKLCHMVKWTQYISDHLFLSNITIQEVIKKSRSYLFKHMEQLHCKTCLKNRLVLKKI